MVVVVVVVMVMVRNKYHAYINTIKRLVRAPKIRGGNSNSPLGLKGFFCFGRERGTGVVW